MRRDTGMATIAALALASAPLIAQPLASPIDPRAAQQYFADMKTLAARDGGRLWGTSLDGPMLFADPGSRQVVANQADAQGKLHAYVLPTGELDGGVFVGKLPPELPIANHGVDWSGVRWTMIMWPLPQNRRPRNQLMAHESFHRVQPKLGLQPLDCDNAHLDEATGRTWLQLEWRALNKALATRDSERRAAIEDALCFRALRRALVPAAARNENRLEANEGVAEYTGVTLSARFPGEAASVAGNILWQGPNRSPFVRSFAYVSGPAYGVLLDESGVEWRRGLKADSDLGVLLAQAYHVTVPPATEAEGTTRGQGYDGDEVIAQEKQRDVRRQKQVAEDRARFLDGPVLALPMDRNANYSFDPNEVSAIDSVRSVYRGDVQVTDAWGILSATRGVMMERESGRLAKLQVPAPPDSAAPLAGDGWKLELKPGWKVFRVHGATNTTYTVRTTDDMR